MAAEIHVEDDSPVHENVTVQLLPIQIKYNGGAKVQQYFRVKDDPEATFNGSSSLFFN